MIRRAFCLTTLLPALSVFAVLAGHNASAADTPSKSGAHTGVSLNAFVNWDFHHREKLRAWKCTAFVIQRTLELWYPRLPAASLVENGSPENMGTFLRSLPAERGDDANPVNLVYLASHQSPGGEWDFTQKKLLSLDGILDGAKAPANPRRIVILDACFATSADSGSWQRFAPVTLYASSAAEQTPEADFHSPQPVDFAHRYPAVYAWLKGSMGKDWDGKISFLGFIWLQTFLDTKSPPRTASDWIAFLEQCQANAASVRQKVSRKCSSTVTLKIADHPAPFPGRTY